MTYRYTGPTMGVCYGLPVSDLSDADFERIVDRGVFGREFLLQFWERDEADALNRDDNEEEDDG